MSAPIAQQDRALPDLRWRSVADAIAYRIVEKDPTAAQSKVIAETTKPFLKIPTDRQCQYRVDVVVPGGKFVTLVPFASIMPDASADAFIFDATDDGSAAAWRCLLRDGETMLADVVSMTPHIVINRDGLSAEPDRYRLLAWDWQGHKWVPIGPYVRLEKRATEEVTATISIIEHKPRPVTGPRATLAAMFTVDTEASLRLMRSPDRTLAVDRQVFGKVSGRELGINFIMDQLDRRGIRGTFFLDILMEYQFGRAALERVIAAIAGRGHDIQLHLHPSPNLAYAADNKLYDACCILTSDPAPEEFARVLGVAVELFVRRVGKMPVAFRNGAYHIHDSYFELFRAAGLRYDSTVYAFKNCHASPWIRGRVQPFEVLPGLWEIPLPWMISGAPEGRRYTSQFTARPGNMLEGAKAAYELLSTQSPASIVFAPMIMHSYTYLGETRLRDPKVGAAWNHDMIGQAPRGRYENMRRGDLSQEFLFLEGINEGRIQAIESQLDAIQATPRARFLAFDELDETLLKAPHGAVEAVCEVHGGEGRLTALRRYPADLLNVPAREKTFASPAFTRPDILPAILDDMGDAEAKEEEDLRIVLPQTEWATAYRLRVLDATNGDVTFVATQPTPEFSLSPSNLPMENPLQVTFYAREAGSGLWKQLGPELDLKDAVETTDA